ncbi:hypothetical protein SAMN05216553_12098 [Lentzea fradiae]|uniref:Uncharacterized protein n=1 Tax=Lentzea fradiae TaxID=200378 RepID=A0A1G8BWM7_9PSEU|nr:hypothetical protein [Lentzea fradiae]SDH37646.1 hypothetical protein SAMN05216553_12098 [Lentzea fradiae]
MGDVVIYEPDEDRFPNQFAWTVTFEPSDEEEWEPFVCGPYEYQDAIALAEAVAWADDDIPVVAVVKSVLPVLSPEEVAATIGKLRELEDEDDDEDEDDEGLEEDASETELPSPEEFREGVERIYQRVLAMKTT